MAAMEVARERVERALGRLEAATTTRLTAGEAALRDRDALAAECDRLRRELDAANDRTRRLSAAVEEAEGRLGEAIARLDALAGG